MQARAGPPSCAVLNALGPPCLIANVRKLLMQIAGTRCKACGHNVVLSSEGKFCLRCGEVVHLACEPRDTCGVCGQQYQTDERPKTDPLRDAILPPALRSATSGGPAFAISGGVAFALLAIIVWYTIEHVLSHGH